jgi:protein-S-isoprenylcysteine O-methyltransferase Ste14
MTVYDDIIIALWLLLVAWWVVAAFGAKRSIGRRPWIMQVVVRIVILVVAVRAMREPEVRQGLLHLWLTDTRSTPWAIAGVAITAAGVGLALMSRIYLGRNWGVPGSRKENPELVTGGPYAAIRHPIYTGILLAMIGSAVGASIFWLAPFLVGAITFAVAARREERLMLEQFPATYPAYKSRTWMFVPLVV